LTLFAIDFIKIIYERTKAVEGCPISIQIPSVFAVKSTKTKLNLRRSGMLYKKACDEGADPVEYVNEQFGGMVSYQNYLNAIRIEYICDIYISDAIVEKQDELTTSELEKYADSVDLERNDALTKRAICVSISGGKTKAEEFKDSFILSGDISAAGLKAFADKNGNTWFEDVFTNEGENEGAISEWLFNMATDVGSFDTVEVKDSGYYLVFFERTGETVYLYRARQLLAEKTVDEEIKAKTAEYKFNISEEKLNAVNA